MNSPSAFSPPPRRAGLLLLAACLACVPLALPAAEAFKLAPEQERALDAARKGFGKAKKLQAEVERQFALAPETNRVAVALALAEFTAAKWPDDAPDSLGRLVQLLPAQAVPLLTAALKAAPKAARPLVSAAMSASPASTVALVGAAVQIAPAERAGIFEAASWRVPKELKPQLEQLKASLPPGATEPPLKARLPQRPGAP